MKNIAVFASGSGTNAENLIRYFADSSSARVKILLSNNLNAYALERAKRLNVPTITFTREQFYQKEIILDVLKQHKIDLIVLAGFLWLIPQYLTNSFPNQIVNIHPALLPNYGGKGMFGMHVHEAVVKNREAESGITIHYVNELYDAGSIIFQARVNLSPDETAESLAAKIHLLEQKHFPAVVETVLNQLP
ncbi:MAG TPA: phosphoribosylglycinamide formyltransferase [Williamwhitmania sp.]|nr:phosphoribosylglycinamide formyltransferase [Williamwhitmania sp.]